MTHEGPPAVFVIHEVAAVRAAIQGARDAAMDSIIRPISKSKPIKGVRVRSEPRKRDR
jgi:hypothetical protein